ADVRAESGAAGHGACHGARRHGTGCRLAARPEPERRPWREWHATKTVAADAEQAVRGRGDGRAADDDRGGVAEEAAAKSLAEARRRRPRVLARQLPRGEVEERDDERQTGRERNGRPGRVVDGARGAAGSAAPRRAEARPTEHERIDRQGRRPQQVGRRQEAPADDIEVSERRRRVVEIGAEEQREGFAVERLRVKGAEQPLEICRGQRRSIGFLERTRVEDDADAGGWSGVGVAAERRRRPGHRSGPGSGVMSAGLLAVGRRRSRAQISSARSWTTTTGASTTIRRLLL